MVEAARESVVQVQGVGGPRGRRGRPGGWGSGAGVVWGDGLVMTNDHVVAGAARRGRGLRVVSRDGRAFDAEVAKRGRGLDLALLRVVGEAGGLPAARVGDSAALRVGALVFAIGHPWGRSGTVTSGVVSGLGVAGGPGGKAEYVLSDVTLAPGNSGGPLLNAAGEVVGINAMISGSQALSVPSNAASSWATGQEERGSGVRLGAAVRPAGMRGAGAGPGAGLILVAVEEDSSAARAGLMVGDVLLGAAGEPLADAGDLLRVLAGAGDAISLSVRRGGRILAVEVSLKTSGPGQGPGRAA